MARRPTVSGTSNDQRLTNAELAALAAQTGLTMEQIRASQAGTENDKEKLRLMAQELSDKMNLGTKELTSKEKVAKLGAALDAMKLSQAGAHDATAAENDRYSEIARLPGMTPKLLADALKAGGHTEMSNALDFEQAKAREALINQNIEPLRSPKIHSEDERQKKFKAVLDAAGAGTYEDALSRAFPKPGATPVPTPTVAPATVSAPRNDTDAITAKLFQDAGITAPNVTVGNGAPTVGGVNTALNHLDQVQQLAARGQPYVEGGTVHNQSAGTEGMDFNTNTGAWIPKSFVGTINGRPATEMIKHPVYSDPLVEHGIQPVPVAPAIGAEPVLNPFDELRNGNVHTLKTPGSFEWLPQDKRLLNMFPDTTTENVHPIAALLAAANGPTTAAPTPTPFVTPTPTGISPEELAQMAEQERERQRRAALAAQAQQ